MNTEMKEYQVRVQFGAGLACERGGMVRAADPRGAARIRINTLPAADQARCTALLVTENFGLGASKAYMFPVAAVVVTSISIGDAI